jgi:hypothetical protein
MTDDTTRADKAGSQQWAPGKAAVSETRPLPEPPDRCPGECGGFGTYPSEFGRWLDADERLAWQLAEARDPSPDGVHHVRCSTCGGTGRRR